jgi:hypothetical protein
MTTLLQRLVAHHGTLWISDAQPSVAQVADADIPDRVSPISPERAPLEAVAAVDVTADQVTQLRAPARFATG